MLQEKLKNKSSYLKEILKERSKERASKIARAKLPKSQPTEFNKDNMMNDKPRDYLEFRKTLDKYLQFYNTIDNPQALEEFITEKVSVKQSMIANFNQILEIQNSLSKQKMKAETSRTNRKFETENVEDSHFTRRAKIMFRNTQKILGKSQNQVHEYYSKVNNLPKNEKKHKINPLKLKPKQEKELSLSDFVNEIDDSSEDEAEMNLLTNKNKLKAILKHSSTVRSPKIQKNEKGVKINCNDNSNLKTPYTLTNEKTPSPNMTQNPLLRKGTFGNFSRVICKQSTKNSLEFEKYLEKKNHSNDQLFILTETPEEKWKYSASINKVNSNGKISTSNKSNSNSKSEIFKPNFPLFFSPKIRSIKNEMNKSSQNNYLVSTSKLKSKNITEDTLSSWNRNDSKRIKKKLKDIRNSCSVYKEEMKEFQKDISIRKTVTKDKYMYLEDAVKDFKFKGEVRHRAFVRTTTEIMLARAGIVPRKFLT